MSINEQSTGDAIEKLPPYLGEPEYNDQHATKQNTTALPYYQEPVQKPSQQFSYVSENIKHYVSQHPEYRDIYAVPAIQNAVNAYVDETVQSHGSLALPDLIKALNYFVDIRNALSVGIGQFEAPQQAQTKNVNSSRRKLTSTVDARGAVAASNTLTRTTTPQPTARESAWKEALKLSPQEYTRWEREPKNRAIVEWVLGQAK